MKSNPDCIIPLSMIAAGAIFVGALLAMLLTPSSEVAKRSDQATVTNNADEFVFPHEIPMRVYVARVKWNTNDMTNIVGVMENYPEGIK